MEKVLDRNSSAKHLRLAHSSPRESEPPTQPLHPTQPASDGRSDDALLSDIEHSYLIEVMAMRARMHDVLEAERRGLHELDGLEAIEQWYANRFGMGLMKASEFVRVATALEELPLLDNAFVAGRISYDHLRWLTRVATPENELMLLKQAEGAPISHVYRLVNKIEGVSASDSQDTREERFLEMRWDLDRRLLLLRGQLPEEEGARFEKAINSLAKQMPGAPEGELPDHISQKRADALAELASSALAPSAPDVKVFVHVDAEALVSGLGTAEIEGGCALSAETAKRLCCDSLVQGVVTGSDGQPLSLGRTRRTVTPKVLRQLRRRDSHCRWPGCRRRNLLDAHHIKHWTEGGPTDFDNLLLLCKTHHYLVHEGGYTMRGDPPHVWIERPSAAPLKCGPPWARLLR